MNASNNVKQDGRLVARNHSQEQGFTLIETAIALVIMMIISLGVASLFAYATHANGRADDRELAMTIAQRRLEWFRTIPFTTQTRQLAYSYPTGGLGATSTAGVEETVTNAGHSFRVTTIVQNTSFVPSGNPDAGAPTVKTIQISVTPLGSVSTFDSVTITTQRSTQVIGNF
jgi:type II secretory pathway pseudopilin PulG